MRITKKVKREIEEEIVDDILCNKCGKTCSTSPGCPWSYDGLLEAHISGGYGSKIGDGDECDFSLCESCLLELFKTFTIKPKWRNVEWGDYNEEAETEEPAIEETDSPIADNSESNS